MRSQNSSRTIRFLRILAMLLFLLTAVSIQSRFCPAQVVSAAKASAGKTVKVPFRGKSGRYLVRRGGEWYLYNKYDRPLAGIRHLDITRTGGLYTGFYMFDGSGRLIRKKGVYYFQNKTVSGVTFNGFYRTTSMGRFPDRGGEGLCWLPSVRCQGKQFGGYYYSTDYGRLTAKSQVRLLENVKIGKTTFDGYYYFDQYGQLCTKADFHTVRQTVGGKVFDGTYYFGDTHGKLLRKSGWVLVGGKKYYITKTGKMLTDCWKSGYYLQSDGTIAVSRKLPDGSYVGYDGRKCSDADAALFSLENQLRSLVGGYSGTWSVYVKDLKTGGVININERSMYPASTIKAFVMAATFDRISRGKLSYNATIRSLMTDMITVSDNESYNALVRYNGSGNFLSGASEINNYLSKNGYSYTSCRHTLHPSSSPSTGYGSNTTSAKDCGVLLERIYRGECVSAAWSQEMMNLLCRQTRRWKIPSGIPAGVKVGNKTGETSSVQNDMAVVFGPKTDYVLCVFSAVGNEYYSNTRIREISRRVYQFLN